MATYTTAELLHRWKQQTLTQEQAIGQLLQHIDEMKQRLTEIEQRLRTLDLSGCLRRYRFILLKAINRRLLCKIR